jgi:hypothetical protein
VRTYKMSLDDTESPVPFSFHIISSPLEDIFDFRLFSCYIPRRENNQGVVACCGGMYVVRDREPA